jgi:hypothetical protein
MVVKNNALVSGTGASHLKKKELTLEGCRPVIEFQYFIRKI